MKINNIFKNISINKETKRRKKLTNSAFSLIELLAVIIIFGILLLIAIPAVSSYMDESKNSTYATTAKEIISGARTLVNDGAIKAYDVDTVYYIPYTCVNTEGARKSPYGEFDQAYVIVIYTGSGYRFYWMSKDSEGMGIQFPEEYDDIDEYDITDGIDDIEDVYSVEGRRYVYVYNEDCTDGEQRSSVCTQEPVNFTYTGAAQLYTAECTGKFKLEVWGAQGGSAPSSSGGKGGYSYGEINLLNGTNLYVYVGGQGQSDTNNVSKVYYGGFNGGGNSYGGNGGRAAGGGGTDIRINSDSLYARVIVAGGGSGSWYWSNQAQSGSVGGGIAGATTTYSCTTATSCGHGGTQTAAGTGYGNANAGWSVAGFGYGGGHDLSSSTATVTGGGGGWYGGGAGNGSGGGSGYVYTASTASSYPTGCLLNSTNYLTNAQTIAGDTSFRSPTGDLETGHSGNGYARITYIGG